MESVIIGIAGGTGSGKSTFTKRLKKRFGDEVAVIYYDNYYLKQENVPFEVRQRVNYDHPDSLETDLLLEHLKQLKEGHAIECPVYDYSAHNRSEETVRVEPSSIILVEGILLLVDERVREMLDIKIFVDADADERILRRIARDTKERGRDMENIMEQYLTTVKPMHNLYVQPTRAMADIVVNSGKNKVAADLVTCKMQSILEEKKKNHEMNMAGEENSALVETASVSSEHLQKVMPFLNEIEETRRLQFEEYFASAPDWLLSAIQVQEYAKHSVFIREGEPADMIYLVGKGTVKAVDYRIYGMVFDFMRFEDVFAFGGMEVIQGTELYQTTLETITPCTIAKIPRSFFAQWMGRDIRALKIETKNVAKYLLEQGKRGRAYLFLQGSNRFALYLVDLYSKYQKNGKLELKRSRQELADSTGLSIKTIDRSLKKLDENGLITREGSKFVMSKDQYEELNIIVSELIDRN